MNKIRIIDLLNKIANGEEVPKKIKYKDKIYIAKGNAIEGFVDYCSDEDEWCFNHYVRYENLNDTVEILEEEKKIPEKLFFTHISNYNDQSVVNNNFNNYFKKTQETINQLIDYLKSKGE